MFNRRQQNKMKNMKDLAIFLIWILAGFLLAASLFAGLVMTVGRGYCTEKWVPRYFGFKMECLNRSKAPRFVIMSGSNAQHTVDCDKLAEALKMDVVCAGLIFTIPMRFYPPMLEAVLHPGDVLYLPLEIWHYRMAQNALTTPFSVSFLWGVYPNALATLAPAELFGLYAKKGLPWVQTVLPKRIRGEIEAMDPLQQYRWVEQYSGTPTVGGFRLRGDNVNNPATTMDPKSVLHIPPVLTPEFRQAFQKLLDMAARRGVRVILGNVAYYSYPWEPVLPTFQELQKGLGLPICGDPAALCLPYCCFTDYSMHCNDVGRRLFTYEITKDICRVLNKPFKERDGWPLVMFGPNDGRGLRFRQPESCTGKPAFGEFILDRRGACVTNVVAQVLVNGQLARFVENVHEHKNMLWVWWNRPEKDVKVEIVSVSGRECRAERVLMESDPSEEIAGLTTFNDISDGFRSIPGNPRRFICQAAGEKEMYLRVRLPNWRSNRHVLHVTLRGGEFLRKAMVGGVSGSSRELMPREITQDGIAVDIALNESGYFVNKDGVAVAGVYFPAGVLRGGEEIVLERLEFERR